MVDSVKGSREIKQTETGDLLAGDGLEEVIVESKESGFCRMKFCVGRLENVEE